MADGTSSHHVDPTGMALAMADLTVADPSTFQHDPLNREIKSIRLMRVLRKDDNQIRCELHNFAMDKCPPYVALSYTWGQGNDHKTIHCNSMLLRIGRNLWEFLFRYQFRAKSATHADYLWIDAVSINQDDTEERNHQVAQMRHIYANASSVIVWLGEDMGNIEAAAAFFPTSEASLTRSIHDLQQSTSLQQWRALIDLLQRSYWRRVWVVQEFVLAQTIDIWCGGLTLNASGFEKLYLVLQDLQSCPLEMCSLVQISPGWKLFKHRTLWRSVNGRERSSIFDLRQLLIAFSGSRSSEARDRIYGFLGIVSHSTTNDYQILADYHKSSAEVIIDVLKHQRSRWIRETPSIDRGLIDFLAKLLRVSDTELALTILEAGPSMYGYLHCLATTAAGDRLPLPNSYVSYLEPVVDFFTNHCDWKDVQAVGSYRIVMKILSKATQISWSRVIENIVKKQPSILLHLHHLVPTHRVAIPMQFLCTVTHWRSEKYRMRYRPCGLVRTSLSQPRHSSRPEMSMLWDMSSYTFAPEPSGSRSPSVEAEVSDVRTGKEPAKAAGRTLLHKDLPERNTLCTTYTALEDRIADQPVLEAMDRWWKRQNSTPRISPPLVLVLRKLIPNYSSDHDYSSRLGAVYLEGLSDLGRWPSAAVWGEASKPEASMHGDSGSTCSPHSSPNIQTCRCSRTIEKDTGSFCGSPADSHQANIDPRYYVFSGTNQFVGLTPTFVPVRPSDSVFLIPSASKEKLAFIMRQDSKTPGLWNFIGTALMYTQAALSRIKWINQLDPVYYFDKADPLSSFRKIIDCLSMTIPTNPNDEHAPQAARSTASEKPSRSDMTLYCSMYDYLHITRRYEIDHIGVSISKDYHECNEGRPE